MTIRIFFVFFAVILISAPAPAQNDDDFEKGFYLGICKTLLDSFQPGNGKIADFEFFISAQDGEKIAIFNFDKSVEKLIVLSVQYPPKERQLIDKFLELLKKYRTGGITAKELKEISWLYYNLIYKTNRDGIKFGYLISQVFTGLNFVNSPTTPENIKIKALNSLWQNISTTLIFSPYFFNSETSDKLFFAYINQDIKTITYLAILVTVNRLKIPLDKKKLM